MILQKIILYNGFCSRYIRDVIKGKIFVLYEEKIDLLSMESVITPTKFIYANFSISTNTAYRQTVYDFVKKNNPHRTKPRKVKKENIL